MDIPRKLSERNQWLVWRHENGTKVPYQTNGQHASSTDDTTWSSLPHCLEHADKFDGIGFVFSPVDPLCGIDLDSCIHDGEIDGWAAELLDKFNTYAEVSPSGNGIKMWFRGKMPGDHKGRNKKIENGRGVEVYDRGRYFTVTGEEIGPGGLAINDCQPQLDEFLERFWPKPQATEYKPAKINGTDALSRAMAYVDNVPGAIAGQDGHLHTIKLAGILVRGFDLSRDDAMRCLKRWNPKCEPEWSDKELEHKVDQADGHEGERGWMLDREMDFLDVNLSGILNQGVEPEPVEADEEDEPEQEEIDNPFPFECIDDMPVLMRQAYDYVMATAIKPQPQLTLASLIALFGAVFGRKVCDDYNTRTNVMVLAVAPSGSGKEHPRQCNKRLLLEAGLESVNAPERIGSHAGIITAVAAHPVRLFQLDEIGRLLATMRDPKVSHLYNIGTVLMALYSSSNTIWTGDAYADLAKVKQINQPHVCVYGTTVPENFYSSLSPDNLTDGLVGRLLVFQSADIPSRRKPEKLRPPADALQKMREWSEFKPPGTGNLDINEPMEIRKTKEADERHESYCDVVNDKHKTEDNIAAAVWNRAPEKAAKLAIIYACCMTSDSAPAITLEAENWGIKLANYSTRLIIQAARNKVAGSKYEATLKFVFSAIPNGSKGISKRDLNRKLTTLKMRDRLEILGDLHESGAIRVETIPTKTKKKTVYFKARKTL